MTRFPTPAALALLEAGIQPKTLAADLGVSPQAVSFHLAGKTAVTATDLLKAIEARGGPKLALRVEKLIRKTRDDRSEPAATHG